ncbi:hypothetical protein O3P69_017446 [Scylla paramamosain]|uniref:Uncharacterized protein n=1 Tax=Scylla paramamosain TaxID=85552 RepID=A0AAW0TVT0_SCYPA
MRGVQSNTLGNTVLPQGALLFCIASVTSVFFERCWSAASDIVRWAWDVMMPISAHRVYWKKTQVDKAGTSLTLPTLPSFPSLLYFPDGDALLDSTK